MGAAELGAQEGWGPPCLTCWHSQSLCSWVKVSPPSGCVGVWCLAMATALENLCGVTWGFGVLSQKLQACVRVTLTGNIGYLIRGKSSSTRCCGDDDRAVLCPSVGRWD